MSLFKKIDCHFTSVESEMDSESREIAVLQIDSLIDQIFDNGSNDYFHENDFAFYGSGWQSWGFGGELAPGTFLPSYIPIIPQWKKYFSYPGTPVKKPFGGKKCSRRLLEGFFFIYLRWEKSYLAIASTGNCQEDLPPIRFLVDRKFRRISCQAYSDGKEWNPGEKIASLCVFGAEDFFELKEKTSWIFRQCQKESFSNLNFLTGSLGLNTFTGGWESWYNHYEKIDTSLIHADLENLMAGNNFIKSFFIANDNPCVFQIDDGWEQSLGQWEAHSSRFPQGMKSMADEIEKKGLIPGLWIAPFIVDWRSDFAQKHRDWLLYDEKGRPVEAGFHLLWGGKSGKNQPGLPFSYYCLDLSQDCVIQYLDSLMEKVIEDWGFRYLKLDFLFAGMLKGKYKNPGPAYIWYSRALKVLTKRKEDGRGNKVAYLGCGMPFESSFKNLPLSRIGPDTREMWDTGYLRRARFPARAGAFANLQSTLGHSFWHKGIFINDPDVIFLRNTNIALDEKEKILIALVNFLFAGQIMISDDPASLDNENEAALSLKIQSLYSHLSQEDFGLVNRNPQEYFIFSKSRHYVGFINLGDKSVKIKKSWFKTAGSNLDDKDSLCPLVEFGNRKFSGSHEVFIFESHSISIYRTFYMDNK